MIYYSGIRYFKLYFCYHIVFSQIFSLNEMKTNTLIISYNIVVYILILFIIIKRFSKSIFCLINLSLNTYSTVS